jgi:hypothetical protein
VTRALLRREVLEEDVAEDVETGLAALSRGRCGTGGVDIFRTCAIPSAVCASSQRVGQDLWALRRAASAFAVAVLKVGA